MRVLVLDDLDIRHEIIGKMLKLRGHEVVAVRNYDEAVEALKGERFDKMFLDHDLEDYQYDMYSKRERTGTDVAAYIAGMSSDKHPEEVVIHSWNPDGAQRMKRILSFQGITVVVQPFDERWI